MFDKHVDKIIDKLTIRVDAVIDLQLALFAFILSIIIAFIFGMPVLNLCKDQSDTFQQSFDYVSDITVIRICLTDFS